MSVHAYPGAVIGGRYRVEHVLGRGGMGLVVGATHLELGQRVALKVLKDEHAADPEIVERLLREARAAAQLKSDHIAHVIDVGRLETGAPYIVMEYLEGRDAGALLAMGPLSISDAVGIIAQACKGLAEAHAAGIVHRDVKPQNLFVMRKDDGTAHVKVLDFGIARQAKAATKLTQTATVIGSPPYMAPEQMTAGDVDAHTDVWALGATLYELLTGRVPFEGATTPEIYARIVQGPADSPRLFRPEIPEPLASLVLRCLSRQPSDRPSDAAALGAELAPFAPAEIAMSLARLAPIAWGTTTKQPALTTRSPMLPAIAVGAGVAVAIAALFVWWPSGRKGAAPATTVAMTRQPAVTSAPTQETAVPIESLPPLATTTVRTPPRPTLVGKSTAHPSASNRPAPSGDPLSERKW